MRTPARAETPNRCPVRPSFRVQDQSSGLYGLLSSTSPGGVVQLVRAGLGCGE